MVHLFLVKNQVSHLALVIFTKIQLRIYRFLEELGFGLRKDFEFRLSRELSHEPVSLAAIVKKTFGASSYRPTYAL